MHPSVHTRPTHALTLGRDIMICDDGPLNSTKFLLFPGIGLAIVFLYKAFPLEKISPPSNLAYAVARSDDAFKSMMAVILECGSLS